MRKNEAKINKKKWRLSIFPKLVISYVVFSLAVIIVFVICLIATYLTATKGDTSGVYPYNVIGADGQLSDISVITNLNGWVEDLDGKYNVTNVYGTKKTDNQIYTDAELFSLTSYEKSKDEKYIGFLNRKPKESGYYLVMYNREDIKVTFTFMISNSSSSITWYNMFMILFFLLFIGLCFLMGYYLSNRIRKPLKQLTSAMEQVKNGAEGVRLDFRAEAEFADMKESFNVMIDSLEEARAQKEDTERKKDKMLLELSHDIRTPIATINSYAVALEEDLVKDTEKKKYYETIRFKAERVNEMADDMFQMLKMKSSEYQLQKTRGDICEFLRQQCVQYYSDAQEQGFEMIIDIPEHALYYDADYKILARVIGNLISNAIKYNKTGKEIRITLTENANQLMIEVADDGRPIDETIADTLFDAFVRGDKSRRTAGGTGLGLSIAKAITEKHNGTIGYQYEDKRNCFYLRFVRVS